MGVDLKVVLFTRPNPSDVVDVLARLDGCPLVWDHEGRWNHTESAKAECSKSQAGNSMLKWTSPKDGGRSWLWHWTLDWCDNAGSIPRSTAKNIALACGLVDFFGGFVQFNDCDQFPLSHLGSPEGVIWHPSNGAMWKAFQDAKAAIVPLTETKIESYDKFAAYKLADLK